MKSSACKALNWPMCRTTGEPALITEYCHQSVVARIFLDLLRSPNSCDNPQRALDECDDGGRLVELVDSRRDQDTAVCKCVNID
jgi:hypothetical protein